MESISVTPSVDLIGQRSGILTSRLTLYQINVITSRSGILSWSSPSKDSRCRWKDTKRLATDRIEIRKVHYNVVREPIVLFTRVSNFYPQFILNVFVNSELINGTAKSCTCRIRACKQESTTEMNFCRNMDLKSKEAYFIWPITSSSVRRSSSADAMLDLTVWYISRMAKTIYQFTHATLSWYLFLGQYRS